MFDLIMITEIDIRVLKQFDNYIFYLINSHKIRSGKFLNIIAPNILPYISQAWNKLHYFIG